MFVLLNISPTNINPAASKNGVAKFNIRSFLTQTCNLIGTNFVDSLRWFWELNQIHLLRDDQRFFPLFYGYNLEESENAHNIFSQTIYSLLCHLFMIFHIQALVKLL